jgi:hypothetical protein
MGQQIRSNVIHAIGSADFTTYIYNKVYASAATTIVINGNSVDMVAGTSIDDLVITSASGSNAYLIGYPKMITNAAFI